MGASSVGTGASSGAGSFNPWSMIAGGGSSIGAALAQLFGGGGYKNPADAAMGEMGNIPDILKQFLMPYINMGNQAGAGAQNEYSKLITDPGGRLNQIGASYHQSPGFQFALDQALQGAGHAAAAGGMAGSPQHEQQNMSVATGLADQDYNNYLRNALGLYNTGLSGEQSMYDTGARAGMGMGEDMASYFANRAKIAYEGQNAENQRDQGIWGALGGGAGSIASLIPYLMKSGMFAAAA